MDRKTVTKHFCAVEKRKKCINAVVSCLDQRLASAVKAWKVSRVISRKSCDKRKNEGRRKKRDRLLLDTPVEKAFNAHVDAGHPLTIGHVGRLDGRRLVVVVMRMGVMRIALSSGIRRVGGPERGGQGTGAAGGVALRRGGDVVGVVRLVGAEGHRVGSSASVAAYRMPATVARVRGRARLGAAVGRVELVIYWCQNTDAGNAAVVVIPMLLHRRMACLQALAPRC